MPDRMITGLTQAYDVANPGNDLISLGLAGFLWLVLIWLTYHQRQFEAGIKNKLIIGFGLGFLSEAVMVAVALLDSSGFISYKTLHMYYPPLQHFLAEVCIVWVMSAYLHYLSCRKSGDALLTYGLALTGGLLIVTLPGWAYYSSSHSAVMFGQTWFGTIWHCADIVLAGSAMYLTLRIPGWLRMVFFAALCCYVLDDIFVLFSLESCETFSQVYNPIRKILHLSAILMFGYVFMREQWELQELSEAELQHNKRELRKFADALELRVAERTTELEVVAMRLRQAEELAHLGYWSYVKEDDQFYGSEEVFNIFEAPYYESGVYSQDLKAYYRPEDCEEMERKLAELLEHGTAYDVTRQICLPDGRIKYIHIKCRPGDTPDEDAVGTLQDVTLQVMMEMAMQERELELIAARRSAEDANRAKSAFLATMSHEIRTPLNAMIGNLTLICMSGLNEEQKQFMHNCTSASQGLLRVINDVLDFSKIEADKIELVNERYSPLDMLENLVNMFACRAEEKLLSLKLDIEGNLPAYILGDCQRLSQIISNLLSNAIKFTTQGDITLAASTTHSGHGATVLVISVCDSGIGIPQELQSVVFDSFTQLDNFTTRRQGGTGLGLAISRRLVEIMEGEITLVSSPGQGSTFTVKIPVAVCDTPAAKALPKKAIGGASRKILLADDDELGRMVVTTLLERKGHTVTAVENGARLLDAVQCDTFDILLTDISMPDMEGTEVARIIRSSERNDGNRQIPIIALTAHAFVSDRERFIDCGFNGYIAKPFNFDELLNTIEELCLASALVPQAADDSTVVSAHFSEP